ncbi:hypothetical protein MKZ38_005612 [Zalerion maritima]|uniref:Rhodopsin domain-containing protein n=1 Tax=Zalerion maritima TaxID=339359 RepID=A0AAD5RKT9_9PEZI|nr:hypothetical protein MKZ38_005612 [Zalerion maritima]
MSSLDSSNASPGLQRGPVLLAVSVTTVAIAFSSCFVRFCIRAKSGSKLGWDDYSIVISMVVGLVGTIMTIAEALSMHTPMKALMFSTLSRPWTTMGAAMAKISICFFFLRLVGKQRPWNILLAAQIVVLSIVNTLSTLTTNLQCQPLEKLWNSVVEGTCWDPMVQQNIGYAQGSFSVFTDFFLIMFPIMMIKDMHVRKNRRWPFYVLAFLSLSAGLCAIIRTYELSITTQQQSYTKDHFTAAVLASLEQNVNILAANILGLGLLLSLKRANEDIEMRDSSPEEVLDDSFFIIEGPRRSSVDTIDREKFLVSTRIAGMWGIGAPHGKQMDETDDERGLPTKPSSLKRKEVGSGSRKQQEEVVEEYWKDDAPLPWGIIKTVSVEVVHEAISDIESQRMNKRDSTIIRKPARAPTAGVSIADGLKNIGGNLRSLAGSMRGGRRDAPRLAKKTSQSQGNMGGTKEGKQDWETILRGGPP